MPANSWKDRSVLVTGHTGFKGGWLVTWLLERGARVTGFALPPETTPSFFEACQLGRYCRSILGDLRDLMAVKQAFREAQPEVVFHLAAQALVLRGFEDPVGTFGSNVMGTVHVLEASRSCPSVRTAVIVTTDKCYDNKEWVWGYREDDALGGADPYSASKACAELVAAAYRRSLVKASGDRLGMGIATARAGNVIGGGDWAANRLVPDAVRALADKKPLLVRNPGSVRPWQHVLEALSGYLMLAEALDHDSGSFAGSWNFGPGDDGAVTVAELADLVVRSWGSGEWKAEEAVEAPKESRYLKLDASKARQLLGWRPALSLREALQLSTDWYRAAVLGKSADDLLRLTREQIAGYEARLRKSRSEP